MKRKTLKKLMIVVLAVITTMAMSATAFADITITGAPNDTQYDAYKILEYDATDGYYISTSNTKAAAIKQMLEGAGVKFTTANGRYTVNSNTVNDDTLKTKIIAALNAAVTDGTIENKSIEKNRQPLAHLMVLLRFQERVQAIGL